MDLARMINTGRPLKLHLGCGTRKLKGYTGVDLRPEVSPGVIADATLLPQEKDASVDEIYACHLLEHLLNPTQALHEWCRVLKYHGVLRLAVPNMQQIMAAYLDSGVHLERLHGLIWGRQDYNLNYHRHGWDYESLGNLLRQTGFFAIHMWYPTGVFGCDYHDFSYAEITAENGMSYPVSLNVQALKI